MEEIVSLILTGCQLAKRLEATNIESDDQHELISRSFDEIIETFLAAKERVECYVSYTAAPAAAAVLIYPATAPMAGEMWLRSRVTRAMDVSDNSSRGSPSSKQRHRRSGYSVTVRVPAPQIGNTEIPPEDGFTWRKYGQKEILNSKFPRSYYRCTHQKLYGCPAKKQAQRLDHDPFTFEILYRGDHTCHMSSTAPTTEMRRPPSTWLAMDVAAGPSSTAAEDQNLVATMADAMFNSGSSSDAGNSMEFLFSAS